MYCLGCNRANNSSSPVRSFVQIIGFLRILHLKVLDWTRRAVLILESDYEKTGNILTTTRRDEVGLTDSLRLQSSREYIHANGVK